MVGHGQVRLLAYDSLFPDQRVKAIIRQGVPHSTITRNAGWCKPPESVEHAWLAWLAGRLRLGGTLALPGGGDARQARW